MSKRLSAILCVSALYSALGVLPVQASETRIHVFTLICDGTNRTFNFNATTLGNNVNRFIQGGSLAVSQPRDGIKSLRLQAAGDPNKTVVVLGFNEVSGRADLTGFIQVMTNASGNVPIQVIGACTGGGQLQGLATVYFFS